MDPREPSFCLYCLDPIGAEEQAEQALDGGNVIIGAVHSGHCAHQFKLRQEAERVAPTQIHQQEAA
jgi:hypothetical protein